MGGCLGTPVDHPGGGGRRRGSGGGRRRRGDGDPNRSSSRRGSGFSDSTSSGLPQTTKVRDKMGIRSTDMVQDSISVSS